MKISVSIKFQENYPRQAAIWFSEDERPAIETVLGLITEQEDVTVLQQVLIFLFFALMDGIFRFTPLYPSCVPRSILIFPTSSRSSPLQTTAEMMRELEAMKVMLKWKMILSLMM